MRILKSSSFPELHVCSERLLSPTYLCYCGNKGLYIGASRLHLRYDEEPPHMSSILVIVAPDSSQAEDGKRGPLSIIIQTVGSMRIPRVGPFEVRRMVVRSDLLWSLEDAYTNPFRGSYLFFYTSLASPFVVCGLQHTVLLLLLPVDLLSKTFTSALS